jgi:hypothetical protein
MFPPQCHFLKHDLTAPRPHARHAHAQQCTVDDIAAPADESLPLALVIHRKKKLNLSIPSQRKVACRRAITWRPASFFRARWHETPERLHGSHHSRRMWVPRGCHAGWSRAMTGLPEVISAAVIGTRCESGRFVNIVRFVPRSQRFPIDHLETLALLLGSQRPTPRGPCPWARRWCCFVRV